MHPLLNIGEFKYLNSCLTHFARKHRIQCTAVMSLSHDTSILDWINNQSIAVNTVRRPSTVQYNNLSYLLFPLNSFLMAPSHKLSGKISENRLRFIPCILVAVNLLAIMKNKKFIWLPHTMCSYTNLQRFLQITKIHSLFNTVIFVLHENGILFSAFCTQSAHHALTRSGQTRFDSKTTLTGMTLFNISPAAICVTSWSVRFRLPFATILRSSIKSEKIHI